MLVLFWDALLSFPHLLLYTLAGLSLAGATRADREYKRESDTRFSTSGFFHESVSPEPMSIPLGPF